MQVTNPMFPPACLELRILLLSPANSEDADTPYDK